jgi:hypothetical protein
MSQTLQMKAGSRPARFRQIILAVAVLMAFGRSIPLLAQVLYGNLTGTVTDASGAVIPKATIEASNKGVFD